jgi:ACT domain-containing protein
VFDHFNKTYRDRTYKFTTMVRHKGTLIAFAMDDKRRIVYSVLDLAGDAQTSVDKTNDKSPFDNQAWA